MLIKRVKYEGDVFRALVEKCGWDIDTATAFLERLPDANAVEVGNCKGCYWKEIGRHQKCSCCRRNPDMKDSYCFAED